jgi:hypothetical protein
MGPAEHVAIPITGILMPLVLVPTILILRHIGRKREWEHLERMKALELGMPVPGSESGRAKVCIAIGAGVPLGALLLAWVASLDGNYGENHWEAAMTVGGLGVVCGSVLAARLFPSRNRQPDASMGPEGKPVVDPDAYDVAGRRGS